MCLLVASIWFLDKFLIDNHFYSSHKYIFYINESTVKFTYAIFICYTQHHNKQTISSMAEVSRQENMVVQLKTDNGVVQNIILRCILSLTKRKYSMLLDGFD